MYVHTCFYLSGCLLNCCQTGESYGASEPLDVSEKSISAKGGFRIGEEGGERRRKMRISE